MFQCPRQARERILLMGAPGTGKSTAAGTIARTMRATKQPGKVWIVDTDNAWERMVEEQFPDLDNIVLLPADGWSDYREAVEKARANADPDDWIVVDQVGMTWGMVQDYFTEQVFQSDIGDYFLQVRKELKGGKKNLEAFSGWTDWIVVNKLYKSVTLPLLLHHTKCHVLAATAIERVSDNDDKRLREMFSQWGVRPAGQKDLAYQFHTVLILAEPTKEKWVMSTVKDRGRPKQDKATVRNFAIDYLRALAGWSL